MIKKFKRLLKNIKLNPGSGLTVYAFPFPPTVKIRDSRVKKTKAAKNAPNEELGSDHNT